MFFALYCKNLCFYFHLPSIVVFLSTFLTLDGGCYHIETSPLICRANHWSGFYMITASVMKKLNRKQIIVKIKKKYT